MEPTSAGRQPTISFPQPEQPRHRQPALICLQPRFQLLALLLGLRYVEGFLPIGLRGPTEREIAPLRTKIQKPGRRGRPAFICLRLTPFWHFL